MNNSTLTETPTLGFAPDGEAIELNVARLSAPHTFIMGGTGAGKSSTIVRFGEIAHDQGVPLLVLDPEGQFGPMRDSCPGTIVIGGDGDIPLDIHRIESVAREVFRNRASMVMGLHELPESEQRVVVAKVLNVLRELPSELWHHRLVIIDEVHNFSPQQGRCESSLPIAEIAARGRRSGTKLLCGTQRSTRSSKDLISQCGNFLVGKLNAAADLGPAIERLGLNREAAKELLKLDRGSFIALGPDISAEPVNLRILKPRTVLGRTLETNGESTFPVLSGEELLEVLRAAHHGGKVAAAAPGKAKDPSADGTTGLGTNMSPSNGEHMRPSSTTVLVVALTYSARKGTLPAVSVPLLLRAEASRQQVEAAIGEARNNKLIIGRKTLAITAAGKAMIASTTFGSGVLAERLGAIRLSLSRETQTVLDIVAAANGSLQFAEIAQLTGYPKSSRKLRRLLSELGGAGLIHRKYDRFASSPGYAALLAL